jgi:hypothetical protein
VVAAHPGVHRSDVAARRMGLPRSCRIGRGRSGRIRVRRAGRWDGDHGRRPIRRSDRSGCADPTHHADDGPDPDGHADPADGHDPADIGPDPADHADDGPDPAGPDGHDGHDGHERSADQHLGAEDHHHADQQDPLSEQQDAERYGAHRPEPTDLQHAPTEQATVENPPLGQ